MTRRQLSTRGILFLLAMLLAYREVTRTYELDFAPVFPGPGSLDQIHYLNMGYTFSRHGIPGFQYSDEFGSAFAKSLNDTNVKKAFPYTTNLLSNQLKENSRALALSSDRPPLYPFFLGLAFKIFGYHFRVGRLLNVILFGITASLVFGLGLELGGSFCGFLAYALFVFLPHTIQMTPLFMTEVPTSLMLAIFCWWGTKTLQRPKNSSCFILGGLLGLVILCRFNFYFCIPSIVISLFLFLKNSLRDKIQITSAFTCGLFFILMPLFSWNVAVSQRLDFFLGTHADRALLFAVVEGYGTPRPPILEMARLTSNYINSHGMTGADATAWSVAHRAVFWETLKSADFWNRVPILLETKGRALFSGIVLSRAEVFLFVCSCLSAFWIWTPWIGVMWATVTTMLLSSILIFPEYGRYLIPCFPVTTVLIALTVMRGFRYVSVSFRGLLNRIPSPTPL